MANMKGVVSVKTVNITLKVSTVTNAKLVFTDLGKNNGMKLTFVNVSILNLSSYLQSVKCIFLDFYI